MEWKTYARAYTGAFANQAAWANSTQFFVGFPSERIRSSQTVFTINQNEAINLSFAEEAVEENTKTLRREIVK